MSLCGLLVSYKVDGKTVKYRASIKYATTDRNNDEVVDVKEEWNLQGVTGKNKWIPLSMALAFALGSESGSASSFTRYNAIQQKTVLSYLIEKEGLDADSQKVLLPIVQQIATFVAGMRYYSASQFTDPARCPTYFEIEDNRLSRRATRMGNDHVQFVYDVYSLSKGNGIQFQEFLSIVGSDGIGLVDTIGFREVEVASNTYQVMTGGKYREKEVKKLLVIPNAQIGGTNLSFNQLSEGTFKTLAIVFYLVTNDGRLLLLEEPEVCVHHGLLESIVELIKTFSAEKQILVTTHSDFVLDSMDPRNVFVVRKDADKGTTIHHIPQYLSKTDYKALREYLSSVGNLGEYWRHGGLE